MSTAQKRPETTRLGGVTGNGFKPGQSGNPGGRPKGLGWRVRELVGEDGELIAKFMLSAERAKSALDVYIAEFAGHEQVVGRVLGKFGP